MGISTFAAVLLAAVVAAVVAGALVSATQGGDDRSSEGPPNYSERINQLNDDQQTFDERQITRKKFDALQLQMTLRDARSVLGDSAKDAAYENDDGQYCMMWVKTAVLEPHICFQSEDPSAPLVAKTWDGPIG